MPYELVRIVSKKNKKTLGFKVGAIKGKSKKPTRLFSKKPMTKKRALAQMRALYASTNH